MINWEAIVDAIAISSRNGGKWMKLFESEDPFDPTRDKAFYVGDVGGGAGAVDSPNKPLADIIMDPLDENIETAGLRDVLQHEYGKLPDEVEDRVLLNIQRRIDYWLSLTPDERPTPEFMVNNIKKMSDNKLSITDATKLLRERPDIRKFTYKIGEHIIDENGKPWEITSYGTKRKGIQHYEIETIEYKERGPTPTRMLATEYDLNNSYKRAADVLGPMPTRDEKPMTIRKIKPASKLKTGSSMDSFINNLVEKSPSIENHLHVTGTISEDFIWDKLRRHDEYDPLITGDKSIKDAMGPLIEETKKRMYRSESLAKELLPSGVSVDDWDVSHLISKYKNTKYDKLPNNVKKIFKKIFTYDVKPLEGSLTEYLHRYDIFKHIISDVNTYNDAFANVVTRLGKHGVSHAEIKLSIGIVDELRDLSDPLNRYNVETYQKVLEDLIDSIDKANAKLGKKKVNVTLSLNFTRTKATSDVIHHLEIIREVMARSKKVRNKITSIDAVARELFTDPLVFKRVFDYASKPFKDGGMGIKILYHAGEDFVTIEDGINSIYRLLHATRPSRLGHGIAMAVTPSAAYDMRYPSSPLGNFYRKNPALATLLAGYRPVVDNIREKSVGITEEYAIGRGNPYTQNRYLEIRKKQRELMDKITKHRIAIEINPSSNLQTGKITNVAHHHVIKLWEGLRDRKDPSVINGKYRVPMILSSDGWTVSNTNLKKEYKIVYRAFASQIDKNGKRIYSDEKIQKILKTIAVDSMLYASDIRLNKVQEKQMNKLVIEIYGKDETVKSIRKKIDKAQSKKVKIPEHVAIDRIASIDNIKYIKDKPRAKHRKYKELVSTKAIRDLKRRQSDIKKQGVSVRVSSLTSSATAGNSHLVQYKMGDKQYNILIDAGLKHEALIDHRLKELGVKPGQIDAIIISHGHSDHVKSLRDYANKYQIPVHITPGAYSDARVSIAERRRHESYRVNESDQAYDLRDTNLRHEEDVRRFRTVPLIPGQEQELIIRGEKTGIILNPFEVSHDVSQPIGIAFKFPDSSVTFVTDNGVYADDIIDNILDAKPTTMILEANHDTTKSMVRFYDDNLNSRIMADTGHASNNDIIRLIKKWGLNKDNIDTLKNVHLIHGGLMNDPITAINITQLAFHKVIKEYYINSGESPEKALKITNKYINFKDPKNGKIKFIWAPMSTVSEASVVTRTPIIKDGKVVGMKETHTIESTAEQLDSTLFGDGDANQDKVISRLKEKANVDLKKIPEILEKKPENLYETMPKAFNHREEAKFIAATRRLHYDSAHIFDPATIEGRGNPKRFFDYLGEKLGVKPLNIIKKHGGFSVRNLFWDRDSFGTSLEGTRVPKLMDASVPPFEELIYNEKVGFIKAMQEIMPLATDEQRSVIESNVRVHFESWGVRYNDLEKQLNMLNDVLGNEAANRKTGLDGSIVTLKKIKSGIESEMSYLRLEEDGLRWKLEKLEEARKASVVGGLGDWTYANKQLRILEEEAVTARHIYNAALEKEANLFGKTVDKLRYSGEVALQEEMAARLKTLDLLSNQVKYAGNMSQSHRLDKDILHRSFDRDIAEAQYLEQMMIKDIDKKLMNEEILAYATRWHDADVRLLEASSAPEFFDEWSDFLSTTYTKSLTDTKILLEMNPELVDEKTINELNRIEQNTIILEKEVKDLSNTNVNETYDHVKRVERLESRSLARVNIKLDDLKIKPMTAANRREISRLESIKDAWIRNKLKDRAKRGTRAMVKTDDIASLQLKIANISKEIDRIEKLSLKELLKQLHPDLHDELISKDLYIEMLKADNEIFNHSLTRKIAEYAGSIEKSDILSQDEMLLAQKAEDVHRSNTLRDEIRTLLQQHKSKNRDRKIVKLKEELTLLYDRMGIIRFGNVDALTPIGLRTRQLTEEFAILGTHKKKAQALINDIRKARKEIKSVTGDEQLRLSKKLLDKILSYGKLTDSDPAMHTHLLLNQSMDEKIVIVDNILNKLYSEVAVYDRDRTSIERAIRLLYVGDDEIPKIHGWMSSDKDQFVSRLPQYFIVTKKGTDGKQVATTFLVPFDWNKFYTNDLNQVIHAPDGVAFNLMSKRGISFIPETYSASALLIPEMTDDGEIKYVLKNISTKNPDDYKDVFNVLKTEAIDRVSKAPLSIEARANEELFLGEHPNTDLENLEHRVTEITDGMLDDIGHVADNDVIRARSQGLDAVEVYKNQAISRGVRLDIEVNENDVNNIADELGRIDKLSGEKIYKEAQTEQFRKPRFRWDRERDLITDRTHEILHYRGEYIKYDNTPHRLSARMPANVEHEMISDMFALTERFGYHRSKGADEWKSARNKVLDDIIAQPVLNNDAYQIMKLKTAKDASSFISRLNPGQAIVRDSLPILISLDKHGEIHAFRLMVGKDPTIINRAIEDGIGLLPTGHRFSFILVEDEAHTGYKLINRAGKLTKNDVPLFREMLNEAEKVISALPWKTRKNRRRLPNITNNMEYSVTGPEVINKKLSIEFAMPKSAEKALKSQYLSTKPKKYVLFRTAPGTQEYSKLILEQHLGLRTRVGHVVETHQPFRWLDPSITEFDPITLGIKEHPRFMEYLILEIDDLPEKRMAELHQKANNIGSRFVVFIEKYTDEDGVEVRRYAKELDKNDVDNLIKSGIIKVTDTVHGPKYIDEVKTTQYATDGVVIHEPTHGSRIIDTLRSNKVNKVLSAKDRKVQRYTKIIESKSNQLNLDKLNISNLIDRMEKYGVESILPTRDIEEEVLTYKRYKKTGEYRSLNRREKSYINTQIKEKEKLLRLAHTNKVEFDRSVGEALKNNLVELRARLASGAEHITSKDITHLLQAKLPSVVDDARYVTEISAKDIAIRAIESIREFHRNLSELITNPTKYAKELLEEKLLREDDYERVIKLGEDTVNKIRDDITEGVLPDIRRYMDSFVGNVFTPVTDTMRELEELQDDILVRMRKITSESPLYKRLNNELSEIQFKVLELKESERVQKSIRSVVNLEREIRFSAEQKFVSSTISRLVDLVTFKETSEDALSGMRGDWDGLVRTMQGSKKSLLVYFSDRMDDEIGKATVGEKFLSLDVAPGKEKELIDGVLVRKKLDELSKLYTNLSRRLADDVTRASTNKPTILTKLEQDTITQRVLDIEAQINRLLADRLIIHTTKEMTPDIAQHLWTYLNKQKSIIGAHRYNPDNRFNTQSLSKMVERGDDIGKQRSIGMEVYKAARIARRDRNRMVNIHRIINQEVLNQTGLKDIHELMTRYYELYAYKKLTETIKDFGGTELHDQMKKAIRELEPKMKGIFEDLDEIRLDALTDQLNGIDKELYNKRIELNKELNKRGITREGVDARLNKVDILTKKRNRWEKQLDELKAAGKSNTKRATQISENLKRVRKQLANIPKYDALVYNRKETLHKINILRDDMDGATKRAAEQINSSIKLMRKKIKDIGFIDDLNVKKVDDADWVPKFKEKELNRIIDNVESVILKQHPLDSNQLKAIRPIIRNVITTHTHNGVVVFSRGFQDLEYALDDASMAIIAKSKLVNLGFSKLANNDIIIAQTAFHRNALNFELNMNESLFENFIQALWKTTGRDSTRDDRRAIQRLFKSVFERAGGSIRRDDPMGKTMRILFNENRVDEAVRKAFRTGFFGMLPFGVSEYKMTTSINNMIKKVNKKIIPTSTVKNYFDKVLTDKAPKIIKGILNGRLDMPRYLWLPRGFSIAWGEAIRLSIADLAMRFPQMTNKEILNSPKIKALIMASEGKLEGLDLFDAEVDADEVMRRFGMHTIKTESGHTIRVASRQRFEFARLNSGEFAIIETEILDYPDGRAFKHGKSVPMIRNMISPEDIPFIGRFLRFTSPFSNEDVHAEIKDKILRLNDRKQLLLSSNDWKKSRLMELRAQLSTLRLSTLDEKIVGLSDEVVTYKSRIRYIAINISRLKKETPTEEILKRTKRLEDELGSINKTIEGLTEQINIFKSQKVGIETELMVSIGGFLQRKVQEEVDLLEMVGDSKQAELNRIESELARLTPKRVGQVLEPGTYQVYGISENKLTNMATHEVKSFLNELEGELLQHERLELYWLQERRDILVNTKRYGGINISSEKIEQELYQIEQRIDKLLVRGVQDVPLDPSMRAGFLFNRDTDTTFTKRLFNSLVGGAAKQHQDEYIRSTEKIDQLKNDMFANQVIKRRQSREVIHNTMVRGKSQLISDANSTIAKMLNSSYNGATNRTLGIVDMLDSTEKSLVGVLTHIEGGAETIREMRRTKKHIKELVSNFNKIPASINNKYLPFAEALIGKDAVSKILRSPYVADEIVSIIVVDNIIERLEKLALDPSIKSKDAIIAINNAIVSLRGYADELYGDMSNLTTLSNMYLETSDEVIRRIRIEPNVSSRFKYGTPRVVLPGDVARAKGIPSGGRDITRKGIVGLGTDFISETDSIIYELRRLRKEFTRTGDLAIEQLIRVYEEQLARASDFEGGLTIFPERRQIIDAYDNIRYKSIEEMTARQSMLIDELTILQKDRPKRTLYELKTTRKLIESKVSEENLTLSSKFVAEQKRLKHTLYTEKRISAAIPGIEKRLKPELKKIPSKIDKLAKDIGRKRRELRIDFKDELTKKDILKVEIEKLSGIITRVPSKSNIVAIAKAKSELRELDKKLLPLQDELELMEKDLRELHKRERFLKAEIKDVEDALSEARREIEVAKNEISRIKTELIDLDQNTKNLLDDNNKIIHDIDNLNDIKLKQMEHRRLDMRIKATKGTIDSTYSNQIKKAIDTLSVSSVIDSVDGDVYRMKTALLQSQAEWIRQDFFKLGRRMLDRHTFSTKISKLTPQELTAFHNIYMHTLMMSPDTKANFISLNQLVNTYKGYNKAHNVRITLPQEAKRLGSSFNTVLLHEYKYDDINMMADAIRRNSLSQLPQEMRNKYRTINRLKLDLDLRLQIMRKEIINNYLLLGKFGKFTPTIPGIEPEFNMLLDKAKRLSGLSGDINFRDRYVQADYTYAHSILTDSRDELIRQNMLEIFKEQGIATSAVTAFNQDTMKFYTFMGARINHLRDILDGKVVEGLTALLRDIRRLNTDQIQVMIQLVHDYGPLLRSAITDAQAVTNLTQDFKNIWNGHIPERWIEAKDIELKDWSVAMRGRMKGGFKERFDNVLREMIANHYKDGTDGTSGLLSEMVSRRLNIKFKPKVDHQLIRDTMGAMPKVTLAGKTVREYLEVMEIGYFDSIDDIADKIKRDLKTGKSTKQVANEFGKITNNMFTTDVENRVSQLYHDYSYAMANQAMMDVYKQNDDIVAGFIRITRDDEKVCRFCGRHHLWRYDLDGHRINEYGNRINNEKLVFLPQHGWCRCFYMPLFRTPEELRAMGLYDLYQVAKENWGVPAPSDARDMVAIIADRTMMDIMDRSRAENKSMFGSDQEVLLNMGAFGAGNQMEHRDVSRNLYIDALKSSANKFAKGVAPNLGKHVTKEVMKKAAPNLLQEYVASKMQGRPFNPIGIISLTDIKELVGQIDPALVVREGLKEVAPGTSQDVYQLLNRYAYGVNIKRLMQLRKAYIQNITKGMSHIEAMKQAMKETDFTSEEAQAAGDKWAGKTSKQSDAEAVNAAAEPLTKKVMNTIWNTPKFMWDMFHPDFYDLLFSFVIADEERFMRQFSEEAFGLGKNLSKVAPESGLIQVVAGGTALSMMNRGAITSQMDNIAKKLDLLTDEFKVMPQYVRLVEREASGLIPQGTTMGQIAKDPKFLTKYESILLENATDMEAKFIRENESALGVFEKKFFNMSNNSAILPNMDESLFFNYLRDTTKEIDHVSNNLLTTKGSHTMSRSDLLGTPYRGKIRQGMMNESMESITSDPAFAKWFSALNWKEKQQVLNELSKRSRNMINRNALITTEKYFDPELGKMVSPHMNTVRSIDEAEPLRRPISGFKDRHVSSDLSRVNNLTWVKNSRNTNTLITPEGDIIASPNLDFASMEREYESVMGIVSSANDNKRTYQQVRLIPQDDGRLEIRILNPSHLPGAKTDHVNHVISALEDVGLPTITNADKANIAAGLSQPGRPVALDKVDEFVTEAKMDQSSVIRSQLMDNNVAFTTTPVVNKLDDMAFKHINARKNIENAILAYMRNMDFTRQPINTDSASKAVRSMISEESLKGMSLQKLHQLAQDIGLDSSEIGYNKSIDTLMSYHKSVLKNNTLSVNERRNIGRNMRELRGMKAKSDFSDLTISDLRNPEIKNGVISSIYKKTLNRHAYQLGIKTAGKTNKQLEDELVNAYISSGNTYSGGAIHNAIVNMLLNDPVLKSVNVTPHQIRRVISRHGSGKSAFDHKVSTLMKAKHNRDRRFANIRNAEDTGQLPIRGRTKRKRTPKLDQVVKINDREVKDSIIDVLFEKNPALIRMMSRVDEKQQESVKSLFKELSDNRGNVNHDILEENLQRFRGVIDDDVIEDILRQRPIIERGVSNKFKSG